MIDALLVTGTDTGVGKTHVGCALARALVAAGLRVGVQKAAETGIDAPWPPLAPAGDALPPGSDADRLQRASGCSAPVTDILPAALPVPAAPLAAARAAGTSLDVDALTAAAARIRAAHDITLVEGAGGLLVPITADVTYADLARRLDVPVLIVARTGLGTLNHTRLTELAARAAGLAVLGVVLDSPDGEIQPSDRDNLALLSEVLDVDVLAELPTGVPPDASEAVDALAPVVARIATSVGRR